MSDTGRRLTREIVAQRMVEVAFAARIEMTGCDRAYWAMIGQWKSILATAKTDEEKRADCLAILRDHIDHLAYARAGQTNAPLRFYADMFVLARQLKPRRPFDPLGRLAIMPAFDTVARWLNACPLW
jgi:hypothetical protein